MAPKQRGRGGPPRSTSPGKPRSTSAAKPRSTSGGKPRSTSAAKQRPTSGGKPRSTSGGKPRSTPAGKPRSTFAGKPASKTTSRQKAQPQKPRRQTTQSHTARATSQRKAKAPRRQSPLPPRRPTQGPKRAPRRVRLADPRKRLRVSLLGICVLMSLFAGRLVQLQGLDASTYAAAARESGRDVVTLPAQRGEITDRNGQPMASTVDSYNITVDQKLVRNPAAYALQIAPLVGLDPTTTQRRLTGDDRFTYLAKGVSGDKWRKIQDLELTGIYSEHVPSRTYPAGAVGGNLVGFVGSDGQGLAGFEQSHEKALAGADGEAVYQTSPSGQRIPTDPGASVSEPTAGTGYQLTIDRDLQWHAEQALADAVGTAGAEYGVATVMDVDTAEILAMASTPVVDPNKPGTTDSEDRRNKAVEDSYEPGSVFKPLTMAAIIEEGLAGPQTVFTVPDSVERSGETIHDYYEHGADPMTLTGIVAKSSNVGTLLAAESIDKEANRQYLSDFGLGRKPDLGLPAETSGHLPTDWADLTRDNIAFGQGVSVSSVQMASAFQAIANGGVRVDPQLVSASVSADGEKTPVEGSTENDGSTDKRVVSQSTATKVTDMMEAVMGPDGTGSPAAVDGYRVAGKTGTAQRIDPDCGCYRGYNSSFMGFAPAEDPQYVVVVSLINPVNGNSGGGLAGPAFASIMGQALEQNGVPPSKGKPRDLPLYGE